MADNPDNQSLLVRLVEKLLNDDHGISNEAYEILWSFCGNYYGSRPLPSRLQAMFDALEGVDGRVYITQEAIWSLARPDDASDCDAPIQLIQSNDMGVVLCGNLSDGYRAVGPFPTLDDALIWSEGHESWCFTMTHPEKHCSGNTNFHEKVENDDKTN